MLNERIKERRKELAMTQEVLARKTGYKTKGAISRIEKGERDLSQSQIVEFAKALNVSPAYLMGWDDEKDLSDIPGIILPEKLKKIPIIGVIACGKPIFTEENYDGYFMLDKSLPQADFILKAKGDSMIEANIFSGDLVFFKRTPDVDNGKIAAVLIEDELALKRVTKSEGILILQPCNQAYSPIVITEKDSKTVLILGEMVGVYSARDK